MTKTLSALSTSRLLPSLVAVALLATCSLELEAAGPRGAGRARLSRDLADRLGSGRSRAVRVIVSGDDARIERLAARHGARIAKRLEGAAVLEIAERTLDAMSDDEETAHLSGDVPVQPADERHDRSHRRRPGVAGAGGRARRVHRPGDRRRGHRLRHRRAPRPPRAGRRGDGLHGFARASCATTTGTAPTSPGSSPDRRTPGMPASLPARTW